MTAVEVLWPIGRSRLAQQHFPREKPYTPMSNDRKLQAGPHLPRTVLPKIEVYKKRATTHFYEYGSPLRYLNIFLIGVRAFRVGGKPHFILRSFILILLSI